MPFTMIYEEVLPAPPGDVEEFRDRATLHSAPWVDGAGQQYDCYSTLAGNVTAIIVVQSDPTGRELRRWRIDPPAEFKIDDFGVFQAGADLLFLIATHEISSAGDRRNRVYRDKLAGVAVPYPAGELPVGAATRYVEETPPEPGTEVDYARIQAGAGAAAAGEVNRLIGLFGSGGIRQALEDKAKDALVELLTAADDPRGQAYREALSTFLHDNDGLYRRLKETMYEVLRDNGLIPPPR